MVALISVPDIDSSENLHKEVIMNYISFIIIK